MKTLRYIFVIIILSAVYASASHLNAQPRLVVNIVVSSLRADDLNRYGENFSEGGFRRLMQGGAYFDEASYDYMQTTTPVSLATLSTGAMPSTHGVVANRWFDYVTNKLIPLIEDKREQSLNFSSGSGQYSPRQLTAQTLSDALREQHPESRVTTIAIEPLSAIVMAGRTGEVYWMERNKTYWTTSTYYTDKLPEWITPYNEADINQAYSVKRWSTMLPYDSYRNSQVSRVEGLHSKKNKRIDFVGEATISKKNSDNTAYDMMTLSPAGNSAVLAFAKQVIGKNEMGKDEVTDILNIVLDTPREVSSHFGPESVEYEDMLYRLDLDLADFITFSLAQVTSPDQLVITLTSDHGTSPSFDSPGKEQERFNTMQAEVITNAFIGAKYGNGQWILGYIDRALYLNHNLIYEKGLSIADMQHEVATFVMQLRGVSHATSAEAMRSSYFGSGYGRKMQNGFYPRRSGDVILNLMPGWIEEQEGVRSSSGSMYRYDTQVPLIIYGGGITAKQYDTKIDMTSLATTLANIMKINPPSAAEGEALKLQ